MRAYHAKETSCMHPKVKFIESFLTDEVSLVMFGASYKAQEKGFIGGRA